MSFKQFFLFFFLSVFYTLEVFSQNNYTPSAYTPVPVFSDQEIEIRIKNLSSLAVTPQLDNVVKSYIKTYSVSRRQKTEKMLGKLVMYFPMFEKYLAENNMPADIKYLSVVESALNPDATSRVGAAGLWQFMPATGKEYGLQINSKLDERRDPVKSTKAAITYLKRLYNKYQDWELALAAYNSGPGRVNRAIRRGKSKNFWRIKKYLPKETRNYVPAFVAANYIVNNYHLHYLAPQFPELDMQLTEHTKVYEYITFREIADLTGTPLHVIDALNPSFKQGIIPTSRRGHNLTLPKRNMGAFMRLFPSPDSRNSSLANNIGRLEFYKSVYYVQPGDNIEKLADLFNCHPRHLMAWNNLAQPYFSTGQELVIYQISNVADVQVKKLAPLSPTLEKPKLKEETVLSTQPKTNSRASSSSRTNSKASSSKKNPQVSSSKKRPLPVEEEYEFHIIRRNESILEIVDKYPGATIEEILKLNKISGDKFPPIGTRLKIKKL